MLSLQRWAVFLCLLKVASLYSTEQPSSRDAASNVTEDRELLENDTQWHTVGPSPTGQLATSSFLPSEQLEAAGASQTEQQGTAGPLPTEQQGTVSPLLTEQQGTAGPLPTEQQGTVSPLLTEQQGTAGPLPTEQQGTAGPLLTEQEGTAGPLPSEQQGTVGPLLTEQQGTAGPLFTEQQGIAGPLPTEQQGTMGPLPTKQQGTAGALLTEQKSTAGLSPTEQLDRDESSVREQPGFLLYTVPITPSVLPSELAVTASEPPIPARDPESSDTGQTRSIPALAISVSSLCVCDLLVAQCDVNCCCDADCSAADFSVFSECSVSVVTSDSQLCTQEAVLYSINSSQHPQRVIESVELVNPSVFCIQKTNYQPALSYITPDEPTEANFDSLLRDFGGHQFITENSALNADGSADAHNSNRYEHGTPILTSDSYLKLPAPMGTKVCTDSNPIGFLRTQDFTCIRVVELEHCSIPALTLGTYTDIQILPVPNSQQGMNVTVQAVTMQSIDGAVVGGNFANEAPFYNITTGICTNVVLGGSYSISYTDQGRITGILASFILGAINSNTVQQTFHTRFIEEGTTPAPLSGNPGYVFGKPLVAGIRVPQSGIIQSSNRFGQLTLLQSSSDQSCLTEKGMRMPVLFGHNMMSGCKLRLNYTGSVLCQLAADATLNALKGQQFPEYVAQFGNSQPENVLDWVPIIAVSPDEQASIQDMCKIPVSLELEVKWTKFGTLINPQPQIVNVTQKIIHAFIPNNLNSGRTVQISTAVTFLDISKAASPGYKAQPTIDAKLPFDFFHPFV